MNPTAKLPGILAFLAVSVGAPAPVLAQPQKEAECPAAFAQDSQTISLLAESLGSGKRAVGERAVRIAAVDPQSDFKPCEVELRFSRLQPGSTFPDYELRVQGRPILPSISEAMGGAQNQIRVRVPASATGIPINISATAAAKWGLQAGQYSEKLQVSVVSANGSIGDQLALDIEFEIPKVASVMFVGATGIGRTSMIDFGVLSSTMPTISEPFGFRIWSSSGYSVELASENKGVLVHSQRMDEIPYDLEVEGRTVDLTGVPALFLRSNHTTADGDIFLVNLTVPARRSTAGDYQDRIMVSVSAI